MRITLLCTSSDHPVNAWLLRWREKNQKQHDIVLCRNRQELPGGDVLFLVSCNQVIDAKTRAKYRHTLVLHASDLPKGRGWSPHIWALLEGAKSITVSMLEAADSVDTGAIWSKRSFSVPDHALYDEIHERLFETELALMDEALMLVESGAEPVPQSTDVTPTYYPKRSPVDSKIDPSQALITLFNTIRVMDPHRYPAYFKLHGHTYAIEIKKVSFDEDD
ncbi:formyltransferase family protein [Halomonas sp. M4R1S46]|uniref:formyltransferase family protein n=1 Tax=Halomonas sp. M4R1S46 TaxID=2982692 RepID=UPI0021E39FC4|nr:formyltransferase family protein [Halomonas sp. M4R1S46]UYG06029.1 formyltransferase family protein [Halomonas sp. M4R1S46]